MAMSRYLYTSSRKKLEIGHTNNSSFAFTSPHESTRQVLPFVLAKQFPTQRPRQNKVRNEVPVIRHVASASSVPRLLSEDGRKLFSLYVGDERQQSIRDEALCATGWVGYIQHLTRNGLQNGQFPVEMDQAAGPHPTPSCASVCMSPRGLFRS